MLRLPVDAGVLVERVGEGTAAARAGLDARDGSIVVAGESYMPGGDVIVALGGNRVSSLEELRDALADHKPGDTVELEIYRGNERRTVEVTLGRQPCLREVAPPTTRCSTRSMPFAASWRPRPHSRARSGRALPRATTRGGCGSPGRGSRLPSSPAR